MVEERKIRMGGSQRKIRERERGRGREDGRRERRSETVVSV